MTKEIKVSEALQEDSLKQLIIDAVQQAVANNLKEWMNMKEAAAYIGVSFNTLVKYRKEGLKVSEIDSVKRISKTEIDRFLNEHNS